MTRHLLWLILLGLFILQGTLLVWLIPSAWQSSVICYTPFNTGIHFVYRTFSSSSYRINLWAFVRTYCTILTIMDRCSVYIPSGWGLPAIWPDLAQRRQPNLIFYNLLITGVGLLLFEFINYGINRLFKLIDIDLKFALTHYMLPSVLFNLLIALICYVPIRKLLEGKRIRAVRKRRLIFQALGRRIQDMNRNV